MLNNLTFGWLEAKSIMRMNQPQIKKLILPSVLLILISVGLVGWIWREERAAAKPVYPLAAGHVTAILLSNHVYGIQGVIHQKLSIKDGKLGEDVFGGNPVTLNSIIRLSVDLNQQRYARRLG